MVLSEETLKDIMERLLKSINQGLCKETHEMSTVKCFVTYVQDLPNGKGQFDMYKIKFKKKLTVAVFFC